MKSIFWAYILLGFSCFSITKEIIYSTNPYYPPYDWSISKNEFTGAGVELLQMVVPKDYKLVPAVWPWVRSQKLAQNGDIDLLINLRITPEREKYLIFTTYRAFANPIAIFIRTDSSLEYDKWSDLKKYKGGVSLGDTFGGGFDEYWPKELKMEVSKNMEVNFEKLLSGRIDYFITGYYMGMAYIMSHHLDNSLTNHNKYISNLDIYFGFSRNSDKSNLIPYISKKLEEFDKNGTTDKLLKKYLQNYKSNPEIFEP